MGWDILQEEWAFNKAAGWKDEDDVLSDDMVNEGIGPDNALKFQVDKAIIAEVKQKRFPLREELFTTNATG